MLGNPIFIKDREGISGCYDISLYVSKAYHKWAEEIGVKKVLNLHISCADKLNEGIPDMFVGDLLEILYHIDNNIIYNLGKEKKHCYIACADCLLELISIQPAGKKRMDALAFANGIR